MADQGPSVGGRDARPGTALCWGAGLFVALFAIVLYATLGQPALLWQPVPASPPTPAALLAQQARGYLVQGQYRPAIMALRQAVALEPQHAQWLADLADALAESRGHDVTGEPAELARQALKLDPDNFKALALSGMAHYQRGQYADAVAHWQRARLQQAGQAPEQAAHLQQAIEEATRRAKTSAYMP